MSAARSTRRRTSFDHGASAARARLAASHSAADAASRNSSSVFADAARCLASRRDDTIAAVSPATRNVNEHSPATNRAAGAWLATASPPAPVRHGPSRRARRRETRRANVLRHAFVVRFSAIATRSFKRRGSRFPLRHQLGILLGVLGARRRERGRQQGRLTAETPREGTVVHLGDERPDDAKRKLRRVRRVRRRVAIDRVEGSQPAHGA